MGTKKGLEALGRELDEVEKIMEETGLDFDAAEELHYIRYIQDSLDVDENLAREINDLRLSGAWTQDSENELLKKKPK